MKHPEKKMRAVFNYLLLKSIIYFRLIYNMLMNKCQF